MVPGKLTMPRGKPAQTKATPQLSKDVDTSIAQPEEETRMEDEQGKTKEKEVSNKEADKPSAKSTEKGKGSQQKGEPK